MQSDVQVRAIVSDIFGDEPDDEFFASLNEAIDQFRASGPDVPATEPAPPPPPGRLC